MLQVQLGLANSLHGQLAVDVHHHTFQHGVHGHGDHVPLVWYDGHGGAVERDARVRHQQTTRSQVERSLVPTTRAGELLGREAQERTLLARGRKPWHLELDCDGEAVQHRVTSPLGSRLFCRDLETQVRARVA